MVQDHGVVSFTNWFNMMDTLYGTHPMVGKAEIGILFLILQQLFQQSAFLFLEFEHPFVQGRFFVTQFENLLDWVPAKYHLNIVIGNDYSGIDIQYRKSK